MQRSETIVYNYDFYFQNLSYDITGKLFELLYEPTELEKFFGKSEIYDSTWKAVNFVINGNEKYNFENAFYYACSDNEGESVTHICFSIDKKIEDNTLVDIYKDFLLPLLQKIDNQVELSNIIRYQLVKTLVEQKKIIL